MRLRIFPLLLLIPLCCSSEKEETGLLIFPYPVVVPASGNIRIQWLHSENGSALLSWGTNDANRESTTVTWTGGILSSVHLSNLQPGTVYSFTLSNGTLSEKGSFRAPDPTAATASFLLLGDTRTGTTDLNRLAARMNTVRTTNSALHSYLIHVGDMVNDGDSECSWRSEFLNPEYPALKALLQNIPVITAPGNHEGKRQLFRKYFPYGFPDSYGRFRHGPVAFFIINQYTTYTPGSPQFTWLTNDLAQEIAPWKVLVLHDGGWNAGSHPNNTDVQNHIQPVCRTHRVRLILAGHNHNYAHALVDGVHHLTIGGGGAPLHDVDMSRTNLVFARKTFQFSVLNATTDLLSITSISDTGETIETFRLTN